VDKQRDVPWAETVAAFGQMMIVRHDSDRMIVLPRYRDDEADRRSDETCPSPKPWPLA
jgi:hypothetical protein